MPEVATVWARSSQAEASPIFAPVQNTAMRPKRSPWSSASCRAVAPPIESPARSTGVPGSATSGRTRSRVARTASARSEIVIRGATDVPAGTSSGAERPWPGRSMPMTVVSGLSSESSVAACCHRAAAEVPSEGRTTSTRASAAGAAGAARTDAVRSMDVTFFGLFSSRKAGLSRRAAGRVPAVRSCRWSPGWCGGCPRLHRGRTRG